MRAVLDAYVPMVLLAHLGMSKVLRVLNREELRPYRDAILTKKLAAMALYQHAADWDEFLRRLEADFVGELGRVVEG